MATPPGFSPGRSTLFWWELQARHQPRFRNLGQSERDFSFHFRNRITVSPYRTFPPNMLGELFLQRVCGHIHKAGLSFCDICIISPCTARSQPPGNLTWEKPRPHPLEFFPAALLGYVASIVTGPDGDPWFTDGKGPMAGPPDSISIGGSIWMTAWWRYFLAAVFILSSRHHRRQGSTLNFFSF